MSLKAFKFTIPVGKPARITKVLNGQPITYEYEGCALVAIANSEPEARAVARSYGEEFGVDVAWLELVDMAKVITIERPKVLVVALT